MLLFTATLGDVMVMEDVQRFALASCCFCSGLCSVAGASFLCWRYHFCNGPATWFMPESVQGTQKSTLRRSTRCQRLHIAVGRRRPNGGRWPWLKAALIADAERIIQPSRPSAHLRSAFVWILNFKQTGQGTKAPQTYWRRW